MQAPISNQEELYMNLNQSPDPANAWAMYEKLVHLTQSQVPTDLLPLHMTVKIKYQSDTALNSYQFLSLASPGSPLMLSDDDKFSSDLPNEVLRDTFRRVAGNRLLRGKLLVLYSKYDETVPEWVDKVELLRRWKEATNAGGAEKWADQSGLVPGAVHKVLDKGQEWLIARIHLYLEGVERM